VTSTDPAPTPRTPARAWLRPALMLLGGALAAVLFVLVDQTLAALAIGV
jgi:LPS O-antigen subunit length determinant protein (WzzB/FepE family)